jgi:hypothetical protein
MLCDVARWTIQQKIDGSGLWALQMRIEQEEIIIAIILNLVEGWASDGLEMRDESQMGQGQMGLSFRTSR